MLEDVIALVASVVRSDESHAEGVRGVNRVLTLSRKLGAGDSGFAPILAQRLALRTYDRELLDMEAIRLGVSEAELAKIDEHAAGIFQLLRPGGLQQRYFDALGQLMKELADQGDVLLVGRGGSRFLRDRQRAFHVRLVATMPVRLRRVMEHRWLREGPAQKLIADSDNHRRRFYHGYFGADWSDPLEYHLTANTGRLGATAVDLISLAANLFWRRAG